MNKEAQKSPGPQFSQCKNNKFGYNVIRAFWRSTLSTVYVRGAIYNGVNDEGILVHKLKHEVEPLQEERTKATVNLK